MCGCCFQLIDVTEMKGPKVPVCVESNRWSLEYFLPSSEVICTDTHCLNWLLEHILQGVKGALCFTSNCQFLMIITAFLMNTQEDAKQM